MAITRTYSNGHLLSSLVLDGRSLHHFVASESHEYTANHSANKRTSAKVASLSGIECPKGSSEDTRKDDSRSEIPSPTKTIDKDGGAASRVDQREEHAKDPFDDIVV